MSTKAAIISLALFAVGFAALEFLYRSASDKSVTSPDGEFKAVHRIGEEIDDPPYADEIFLLKRGAFLPALLFVGDCSGASLRWVSSGELELHCERVDEVRAMLREHGGVQFRVVTTP